jgi:hypothetical protein
LARAYFASSWLIDFLFSKYLKKLNPYLHEPAVSHPVSGEYTMSNRSSCNPMKQWVKISTANHQMLNDKQTHGNIYFEQIETKMVIYLAFLSTPPTHQIRIIQLNDKNAKGTTFTKGMK